MKQINPMPYSLKVELITYNGDINFFPCNDLKDKINFFKFNDKAQINEFIKNNFGTTLSNKFSDEHYCYMIEQKGFINVTNYWLKSSQGDMVATYYITILKTTLVKL